MSVPSVFCWKMRPFGTLHIGYDTTRDHLRREALHQFGMVPQGATNDIPVRHWGFGPPVRCAKSGEFFPSSRIVQQFDGRYVGDIYLTRSPRYSPPVGGTKP